MLPDDDDVRRTLTRLLVGTGWDVADLGGIDASRYLEPLCIAWVAHGPSNGTWDHAFRLLVTEQFRSEADDHVAGPA